MCLGMKLLTIVKALERHAAVYAAKEKGRATSQMEDMALVELLKLVFNLAHFVTDIEGLFSAYEPPRTVRFEGNSGDANILL